MKDSERLAERIECGFVDMETLQMLIDALMEEGDPRSLDILALWKYWHEVGIGGPILPSIRVVRLDSLDFAVWDFAPKGGETPLRQAQRKLAKKRFHTRVDAYAALGKELLNIQPSESTRM